MGKININELIEIGAIKKVSLETFMNASGNNGIDKNFPELRRGIPLLVHLKNTLLGLKEEFIYEINGVTSENIRAIREIVMDKKYTVTYGLRAIQGFNENEIEIQHYAIIKK